MIGGKSWDDLCEKVERLLDVYEQWHLSISVEKSGWGMSQVEYLGHNASVRGLQAKPKNVESLMTLEFPRPLKGLQAFLGSRNYYHRLIADFALATKPEDRGHEEWEHAVRAFEVLKSKLATAPILKHFDSGREVVVTVYANDWASSGVLAQVHDDVCMPVKFTSRTLKPNERNYDIVEKAILAVLRVLNGCYAMLAERSIRVLTRHTTLAWPFRSKGLQGRLSQ
ncbi:reverse transcriptase [Phytophthora cinnamomi]|uniref:reverse transcriptase n=1 Tax=Phytophthora cinnamomi TaxID=4785 RepID=UPI0035598F99|nr:reverse transcriptase [Phytophthora cinnamomi]